MATKLQRAANRRNSKLSTGPKTPEGKAICSLNSLRDGLCATTLILPNEDKNEFDNIIARYELLYLPDGPYEEKLVELLARAEWKMMRADRLGAAIYEQYGGEPPDALSSPYDRAVRIEARHQRVWSKISKELETIRAARLKAAQQKEAQQQAARQQSDNPPPPQAKPAQQPRLTPKTALEGAKKRGYATPEEWNAMTDKERRKTTPERHEVNWIGEDGKPWMTVRNYRGKFVEEFPPEDPVSPEESPSPEQSPSPEEPPSKE